MQKLDILLGKACITPATSSTTSRIAKTFAIGELLFHSTNVITQASDFVCDSCGTASAQHDVPNLGCCATQLAPSSLKEAKVILDLAGSRIERSGNTPLRANNHSKLYSK
ncbi:MAG: hypothetical protein RSB86_19000 [Comamonas sp.]|uniref:hypothetical protein n=1 Tax=Comamonas sp. TaxID=34028 RepID=UPI002FCB2539